MASHEKILYDFYGIYWRPPKRWEFEACGGDLGVVKSNYGSYGNFIKKMGYGKPYKGDTYIVIDLINLEAEFIGTKEDIAYEYDWSVSTVTNSACRNLKINQIYTIRLFPFTGNIYERGLVA